MAPPRYQSVVSYDAAPLRQRFLITLAASFWRALPLQPRGQLRRPFWDGCAGPRLLGCRELFFWASVMAITSFEAGVREYSNTNPPDQGDRSCIAPSAWQSLHLRPSSFPPRRVTAKPAGP